MLVSPLPLQVPPEQPREPAGETLVLVLGVAHAFATSLTAFPGDLGFQVTPSCWTLCGQQRAIGVEVGQWNPR